MDESKATIIFLDGAPSSGKTTIALALQDILEPPFVYIGIDHFLHMLPNGGFCTGGIELIGSKDAEGHPSLAVEWGETFEKLLLGYREALLGMAKVGNFIITDVILSRPKDTLALALTFRSLHAYLIGIYAPLEVLEKRERTRNEPQGLARGRFHEVYGKPYDLLVDTSQVTPEQAARAIKKLAAESKPKAWQQIVSGAGYKI